MAVTNDFVPFATASGANVEDQADYAADATTQNGFSSGIAPSAKFNKAMRQASIGTSALATFISNELNASVADDGNITGFVANLVSAIKALTGQSAYADKTTAGTDTVTVPAWATRAEVQMVGGGGGGGGSAAGFSGGGGGAGGYSFGIVAVTPGATLTRTVGAGGAGSGGPGTASAGGNSALTGFGSATGGGGGTGGTSTSAGGQGGTASNANVRNFTGGTGGDGNSSNQAVQGGNGAAGPFGGEGRTGAGAGVKGQAPGAGGGGAWNANGTGGAGADGAILIRFLP